MKLHLPDVEANAKPGIYKDLIGGARKRGEAYPKIWDLFAFQPPFTAHLSNFTEGVLRTPVASLSPGMRELIAAFTSYLNECAFCTKAHAAAASELLGEDLVAGVLHDLESSALRPREKALLRFTARITIDLPTLTKEHVTAVRGAGWDDEAIYFAITTCALFNFYNRWITATGVPEMSAEAHRLQGQALARHGYLRGEK
ncbi:MAG: peroxidase-related enzyme [Terriglobia bacterium]